MNTNSATRILSLVSLAPGFLNVIAFITGCYGLLLSIDSSRNRGFDHTADFVLFVILIIVSLVSFFLTLLLFKKAFVEKREAVWFAVTTILVSLLFMPVWYFHDKLA